MVPERDRPLDLSESEEGALRRLGVDPDDVVAVRLGYDHAWEYRAAHLFGARWRDVVANPR